MLFMRCICFNVLVVDENTKYQVSRPQLVAPIFFVCPISTYAEMKRTEAEGKFHNKLKVLFEITKPRDGQYYIHVRFADASKLNIS